MQKLSILIASLIILLSAAVSQTSNKKVLKEIEIEFGINKADWNTLTERLKFDNNNISENGINLFQESGEYLLTGYVYGEFYDWDLYFENIYLSYFGVSDYCFTNLKAFLKRQHLNGFVSRTLIEVRPYQQFKPFLAQTAALGSKQTGDYTWLNESVDGAKNTGPDMESLGVMNEKTYVNGRSYYERLKHYIDFWFWYQDFDKNGLPVWNSSDHSGMDNQFARSGSFNAFRFEGVDLACYLYRELKAMALIAKKLNKQDDVANFNSQAEALIESINKYFWNEEDGFYYDRDERTGEHVKVKTIAGFMPLYIGAASKEQAERLVNEHLLNENEFYTKYPIAAYSKSEPDYDQSAGDHGCNWRGTTWIPTNYMVFHGLLDYGFKDIAKELADKTFDMALRQNATTREYYNGETGQGLGLDPFFGWSTLAYFMPIEYSTGYNPMKLEKQELTPMAKDLFNINFPEKE